MFSFLFNLLNRNSNYNHHSNYHSDYHSNHHDNYNNNSSNDDSSESEKKYSIRNRTHANETSHLLRKEKSQMYGTEYSEVNQGKEEEEEDHQQQQRQQQQLLLQKETLLEEKEEDYSKSKRHRNLIIAYIFLIISMIMMLFVVIWEGIVQSNMIQDRIDDPDYSKYNDIIDITLLGDSLFNKPINQFNLENKIQSKLKINQKFNAIARFHNAGKNGETISQIKDRLESVLYLNSSALLLYWDSDMDDLDESILSESELEDGRNRYKSDLRYVIERSMEYGTDVITIAGPGIYSEGPFFVPISLRSRNIILDEYRQFNKEIATEYNIPYTDIRQAFLDAIPLFWIFSRWYVTVDGEHPNNRGTTIAATLFASQINTWLESHGYW